MAVATIKKKTQMWLSSVLHPSSRPSFRTLRVTCPSSGTHRGDTLEAAGLAVEMGGCLERYILPWEQVIIKNESRRSESISTPSRRPINTTSAPYKHQGRVARLHLETPQHNCVANNTTETRLSDQVCVQAEQVDCRGFCKSVRKHTFN